MSNSKDLLDRISVVRRDIGNLLFHFTKGSAEPVEINNGSSTSYLGKGPDSVLQKILNDKKLIGSSDKIRGGHKCVCFSEAPITELASLFSLARIADHSEQRVRYEPYGIAVSKQWLFERGGRPVIYQPVEEYESLSESMQFRHMTYDLRSGIDLTWEREWRIKTNELMLDPKHTLVVVPKADEAFRISYAHAYTAPDSYDEEGLPEGIYHSPQWMVVSLDLFGLNL